MASTLFVSLPCRRGPCIAQTALRVFCRRPVGGQNLGLTSPVGASLNPGCFFFLQQKWCLFSLRVALFPIPSGEEMLIPVSILTQPQHLPKFASTNVLICRRLDSSTMRDSVSADIGLQGTRPPGGLGSLKVPKVKSGTVPPLNPA